MDSTLKRKRLYLDFETRSELDLKEVQLDRYSRDESTRALMIGWAIDDGPVTVTEGEVLPPEVLECLNDPTVQKIAWNATFEIAVLLHRFRIEVNYVEWLDPMVWARYLTLPGSLEHCPEALGLTVLKDVKGGRLKGKFCGPAKATPKMVKAGHPPTYWRDKVTDPEDWETFKTYCGGDISTTRETLKALELYPPVPAAEWNLWRFDQMINLRGIHIDLLYVQNALTILAESDRVTRLSLMEMTAIENLNSYPQVKDWLTAQGFPMASIAEGVVNEVLAGDVGPVPELVRDFLTERQKLSGAGPKKLAAIVQQVSPDHRLRHQFGFYCASTGRWAGRGVQPHNLPKPDRTVEDRIEEITDAVRSGYLPSDLDVSLAITSTVRSAFRAAEGNELVIVDYSSIENVVLAWLSDCVPLLNVYREKRCAYRDFATRLNNIPYNEVTSEQRRVAKPAVLGCFASDTLVMTSRGWIPIVDIHPSDLLWDGVEWVSHQGVIDQGEKETINMFGVRVTPDHLIYTGDATWCGAESLRENTQLAKLAIASANGSSYAPTTLGALATTGAYAPAVELRSWSLSPTLNLVKRDHVSLAQTLKFWPRKSLSTIDSTNRERSSIGWPTVITRWCLGAGAWVTRPIVMEDGEFPVSSPTFMNSLGTALHCLVTATQSFNWIVKRITATTREAIFDSSLKSSTTGIRTRLGSWNTPAASCAQLSSGKPAARHTEVLIPSVARSEKDSRRNRSSGINQIVAVPTFDVANAGPRNRFMIWTNAGPLIAHNCGYGMGSERLALYARSMRITMTEEEAFTHIKAFRESYPEIPALWATVERHAYGAVRDRAKYCMGHGLVFDGRDSRYLKLDLPSGRSLFYLRPQIVAVETQYGLKDRLTFEAPRAGGGALQPAHTYGGSLVENIVQALARDILCTGLLRAHRHGYKIVLHVHDEIVAEQPIGSPLTAAVLEELMSRPPAWVPDMLLGAKGAESAFYQK